MRTNYLLLFSLSLMFFSTSTVFAQDATAVKKVGSAVKKPDATQVSSPPTTKLDMTPESPDRLRTLSEQGLDLERMNKPEWREKHRKLVRKAISTPAQLQFFGDSITEYMDRGGLKAFQKNFGAYMPDNFGLAGDKAGELFWRMNHGELRGHPKVIVIMIGTNDFTRTPKRTAHEVAQEIANCVRTARAYEPKAKILLMALLPRDAAWALARGAREQKRKDVNAEIATLANGNQIRFIDIGDRFVDHNGLARVDLMPDYLHPNLQGYEVWAEAIKPTLDDMLK